MVYNLVVELAGLWAEHLVDLKVAKTVGYWAEHLALQKVAGLAVLKAALWGD